MGDPLPIKLYETLNNLLKMYTYPHEEVLVLEAVANGIDANADRINISFEKDGNDKFILFQDNGRGMTSEEFENYHTISLSSKTKGEGIGFAGVGAKIFLASDDGSEIITITSRGNKPLASKMYRKGTKVEYETSERVGLEEILDGTKVRSFRGTIYKVKLTKDGFDYLLDKITEILQFWFNQAIISETLQLYVDGKSVKYWKPKGTFEKKIVMFKKEKIPCYYWITEENIPETLRHIVYSVYGKRIRNELVDFSYQIKGDLYDKVFCIADVSILAKHLNSNKEDFMKNYFVNGLKSKIKSEFYNFLQSKGLIIRSKEKGLSDNVITNELTRRLDKLLQQKDLKFLNPWLNPRIRFMAVADENGSTTIKEVEGSQTIHDEGKGGNGDGIFTVGEDEAIKGYTEDKKGDLAGTMEERRARGMSIIIEDYPDDPREGWIDMNNRGVVYNSGNKFAMNFQRTILFEYNVIRVIISTLVKAANDKVPMDAKVALDTFEKVLHSAWL